MDQRSAMDGYDYFQYPKKETAGLERKPAVEQTLLTRSWG